EAHEKLELEKASYRKGAEIAAEGGAGKMSMMDTLGMLQKGGKVLKELEAALTPADMQTMRNMLLNQGVRKVIERPQGEYKMPNDGDAQVKNKKGGGNEIVAPIFPWDRSEKAVGRGSRRAVLAEAVTHSRQFAAVQVNRLWAGVFGKGIVDPLDDFREKNPPSNPELLDYLAD